MIEFRIDASDVRRRIRRISEYAASALDDASTVLIQHIRRDTKRNRDADGNPFPAWTPYDDVKGNGPYSPSQERKRKAAGVRTDKKDLFVVGDMLESLGLRGRFVTVADDQERKAHGQLFHPKWRYHHHFLYASDDAVTAIADLLAKKIEAIR
jgi:hypothetical protein